MPLYDYECPRCKLTEEKVVALKDLNTTFWCTSCYEIVGGLVKMKRLISAVRLNLDYEDYNCPVTGKLISGRRQHEENLKVTGCRVLEPGEREDAQRKRKARELREDQEIEESVAKEVASWSPEKQAKLGEEFERGADTSYERGDGNGEI